MRHKFRKFGSGLWVSPAEDEIPDDALRRGRCVDSLKTGSIRSRLGMSQLHNLNAHSIVYFNDTWYYGSGTVFYEGTTSKKTGLNGSRLHFTSMPPMADISDYLFVTRGGTLFKVDTSGNVTNWGIAAPDTSLLAGATTVVSSVEIDDMQDHPEYGAAANMAHERWQEASTLDGSSDGVVSLFLGGRTADGLTRNTFGCSLDKVSTGGIVLDYNALHGAPLDLTTLDVPGSTVNTDFITFWLALYFADIEYLQLDFSLGSNNFRGPTYTVRLVPSVEETATTVFLDSWALSEFTTEYTERTYMDNLTTGRDVVSGMARGGKPRKFTKKESQKKITEKFNALAIPQIDTVYQKIRIAKNLFTRTGEDTTGLDWSDVYAIRFRWYCAKPAAATTWTLLGFGDMQLEGGVGMQGTYQYNVTFRNSTTGHRSNPGEDVLIVEDNIRQGIELTNVPVSADPQVDEREIWRTIGDGTILWYAGSISDNTTTTFTDDVADPDKDFNMASTVLSPTEMQYDNEPPYASFTDCAFHIGTAFWIDSNTGRKGNVYYSPTGRTESMKGYLRVTNDDDPLQRLFRWNDALYTISESGIFRIDGSDPFVSRRVYGCPGTVKPDTLCVSSDGVFYEGDQGVRVFNGMTSKLAAHDAVACLFRGEAAEQLTSFSGVVAVAGKGEYFISDTSQTLAISTQTGTWRDIGVGANALAYAKDAEKLAGTFSSKVCEFEKEGIYTDNGASLSFHIQTKTIVLDEEKETLVQRVHIDFDSDGQNLTVTALLDGVSLALGTINLASRETTTIAIGRYSQRVAIRITGTLTSQVEIFGIELDTNHPGEGR